MGWLPAYFIPSAGLTDTRSRDFMKPSKLQSDKPLSQKFNQKETSRKSLADKICKIWKPSFQSSIKSSKSQSAMEYLMTYAWAILIIVIVIVVLFWFGLFGNNLAPRAQPGNCYVTQSRIIKGGVLAGTCNGELPEFVATMSTSSAIVTSTLRGMQQMSSNGGAITITEWSMLTQPSAGGSWATYSPSSYPTMSSLIDVNGCGAGTIEFVPIIYFTGSSYSNNCIGPVQLPSNQWLFVAIEISGSTGTGYIYVPGTAYSGQFSPTWGAYTLPPSILQIGPVAGLISNVQVYNASLPASDIQALYMEGIGGAPTDLNYLIGWWPLNGNTNDYSGYNNNGVPTSITYSSSWVSAYTQP